MLSVSRAFSSRGLGRSLSGAESPQSWEDRAESPGNQSSLASTGRTARRTGSPDRALGIWRALSWIGASTWVRNCKGPRGKLPQRVRGHVAEHSHEARNYAYSTSGTGKCHDSRTWGGRHRRPPLSRRTEFTQMERHQSCHRPSIHT